MDTGGSGCKKEKSFVVLQVQKRYNNKKTGQFINKMEMSDEKVKSISRYFGSQLSISKRFP